MDVTTDSILPRSVTPNVSYCEPLYRVSLLACDILLLAAYGSMHCVVYSIQQFPNYGKAKRHMCHAFAKNACVYMYLITPSAALLFTLSDRKP
ncbi:hypothetical protein J6590_051619 [Homalodisca vitripennis]|nr:hypothetical protein J6590_051619 [Homalodisca vitripennis]